MNVTKNRRRHHVVGVDYYLGLFKFIRYRITSIGKEV
jgi:hypothetical protein